MRLGQLLAGIDVQFEPASGIDVLDLTLDSRKVTDGTLFVAVRDPLSMEWTTLMPLFCLARPPSFMTNGMVKYPRSFQHCTCQD